MAARHNRHSNPSSLWGPCCGARQMIVRSANRQVWSDGVQLTEKVGRWLVRNLLIKMMMCSQAADDVCFDKMPVDAQATFLQGYLILQKKNLILQRLFTQRQAQAARTPCDECTADKEFHILSPHSIMPFKSAQGNSISHPGPPE